MGEKQKSLCKKLRELSRFKVEPFISGRKQLSSGAENGVRTVY